MTNNPQVLYIYVSRFQPYGTVRLYHTLENLNSSGRWGVAGRYIQTRTDLYESIRRNYWYARGVPRQILYTRTEFKELEGRLNGRTS